MKKRLWNSVIALFFALSLILSPLEVIGRETQVNETEAENTDTEKTSNIEISTAKAADKDAAVKEEGNKKSDTAENTDKDTAVKEEGDKESDTVENTDKDTAVKEEGDKKSDTAENTDKDTAVKEEGDKESDAAENTDKNAATKEETNKETAADDNSDINTEEETEKNNTVSGNDTVSGNEGIKKLSVVSSNLKTLTTVTYAAISMGTKPPAGITQNQPFIKDTTAGSTSFRIPGLVTLDDGSILAVADARWNTTYDGGGLDTIVSRSENNGDTWTYRFANYYGDNGNSYSGGYNVPVGTYGSTNFIDPSIAVRYEDDGKGGKQEVIYLIVDLQSYGVALNGSGNLWPSKSETGFDSQGRLLLSTDSYGSESTFNNRTYTYNYYLEKKENGTASDFYVIKEVGTDAEQTGYTVDDHFNITTVNTGENSNLFFSDSPFKAQRTAFIYLVKSTDKGQTWSSPILLPNIKNSSERAYLISPAAGITTSKNEIVFPGYSFDMAAYTNATTQRVNFIYSTDGVNWVRSANAPVTAEIPHHSESSVVELDDGRLRFFIRSISTKRLTYIDFIPGDQGVANGQWSQPVIIDSIPVNSNCQMSVIKYSKTSGGKEILLVSAPRGPLNEDGSTQSGASYRLNGRIFVGLVNKDDDRTIDWQTGSEIIVNNNGSQFMYSDMTELNDGQIAILYEMNEAGWGYGSGKYYEMTFEKKTLSGIDFDPKFTQQPSYTGFLTYGDAAITLTAATDGQNDSYQWYKKTAAGEEVISGANQASYSFDSKIWGSGSHQIYCKATRGTNGTAVSDVVTIEVKPAVPSVTIIPLDATYGQKLNEISLPPHNDGDLAWINGENLVGNVGEQIHQVTFTPRDTSNYQTTSIDVKVQIKQKELTVLNAKAEAKAYDGSKEVKITGVDLNGIVAGDDVKIDLSQEMKGNLSGKDAGSYDKVILPAVLRLTGNTAANYLLTQPSTEVSLEKAVEITKVKAALNVSHAVYYTDSTAQSIELAASVKGLPGYLPTDKLVYSVTQVSDLEELKVSSEGILTFKLPSGLTDTAVKKVNAAVQVTGMTNYIDPVEITLTVNITEKPYKVTILQAEGGEIAAKPKAAEEGEKISLSYKLNTDYKFKEWKVTGNNQAITVDASNQFSMPKGNVTVTAVFEKIPKEENTDQTQITTPVVETDSSGNYIYSEKKVEDSLKKVYQLVVQAINTIEKANVDKLLAEDTRLKTAFEGMKTSFMDISIKEVVTGQTVQPTGTITFILGYPGGTGIKNEFIILHMEKGINPILLVEGTHYVKEEKGIRITLDSFSPFVIGWKETSGTPTTPGQGSTTTPTTPGQGSGTTTPTTPGQGSGTTTPTTPGQGSGTTTPTTPGQGGGTTTPTAPNQGSSTTTPSQSSGTATATLAQGSKTPVTTAPAAVQNTPTVSPKTGDNTPVAIVTIILAGCVGVFGYCGYQRKKENNHE